MQLRVPKKYQASKRHRRRLFRSRRWMVLWLVTFIVAYGGYWILQNPTLTRDYMDNFRENVGNEVGNARERYFPDPPTATPDVRDESVEAENAYRLGDYEQAIELYREVVKGKPNDAGIHFRLAYLLLITSGSGSDTVKINEALEMAQATISANPESPLGWMIQAMALDWGLQHNRALASAQRALEIDPSSIFAKAVLGNIYRNLGDLGLSKATFDDAIAQIQRNGADNETVAQVYRNYGRYLSSQADYEGAADAYQRARQAMPTATYITIELANYVYLDPSETETAINLLEETLDTNPRDAAVLSQLGQLYYSQGVYDRANERFQQCIIVNQNYIDCYSALGKLEFFVNANYGKVIEYLTTATRLGSSDPYDYFLLARSYYRLQPPQCEQAAKPLRDGYNLMLENGETNLVKKDDFLRAFTDCGLAQPQAAPQVTPTTEVVATTPEATIAPE
ncbi:MAG: tetratricopeptide repeat protein [Chloroflexi bacterium]|nr:tetratricopeptide repeat protein [Chloroflexota bacterium]NOG65365.1 tetratricopeptide repeat protein [Chloroflexota bacterium]